MRAPVRALLLVCLLPWPASADPGAVVGQVNTVWVIPELGRSWVESLHAHRLPGGGLYQVDGFVAERDLALSIRYAIEYLSRHPAACPGFAERWKRYDLYFTWPDPNMPRGGPSAGVAFAVAAYSALVDLPVRQDVALTGAVEPDGRVLSVGGIEYKVSAARSAGMRTLCVPAQGAPAPAALSLEVVRRLRIVTLETVDQAFFEAFGAAGREIDRYDRVTTLWALLSRHMARREDVAARLALDELVELVPNDLSAQRLRQFYDRVDMTGAAENLFADAAQYERDGLPDEALKAARRAWSYADEPTRARHRELLARLEQGALPATARDELERAESLVRRGEVGAAYRVAAGLLAAHPDQPYLQERLRAWAPYADVARLEERLQAAPDDLTVRAALAEALLVVGAPWRAAAAYAELAERQPDQVKWPLARARAEMAAGKPAAAAAVLRGIVGRWPVESAQACAELGIELEPPSLTLSEPVVSGLRAECLIRSVDRSGVPLLTALLDGTAVTVLRASPARLEVDLGRLAPGRHGVAVVSADKFENESTAEVWLDVPERDVGPCLRIGPAPDAAPDDLLLPPGGPVAVLRGSRLWIDGGDWFGLTPAPLRAVVAADARVDRPPFRLTVETAPREAERWELSVVPELTEELPHPGRTVSVSLEARPPVWIVSPPEGTRLDGTVAVIVGAPAAAPGTRVELWVDDRPHLEAGADEPLQLGPDRLTPGPHRIRAVRVEPDGDRAFSPAVRIEVAGEIEEGPTAAEGEVVLPSPTGALLAARAELPHPAVRLDLPEAVLALRPATDGYAPGQAPAPIDTAIRFDVGWPAGLRRVRLALGDVLGFARPIDPQCLDPEPLLREGPLASTVWIPREAGSYRLTREAGDILVSIEEKPFVGLVGPPSGAVLRQACRFRFALPTAVAARQITLLDNDRPLGTWPAPGPAVILDPLLLEDGWHALRAAVDLVDGSVALSPPVVVAIE